MAGRFSFVQDAEVENVRETTVPENTKKHTAWSGNVYKEWAEAREREFKDFEPENKEFVSIPAISEINIPQINYWLSKFALEVRKKDGTEYRHEVLYTLFCGLNRIIREKIPDLNLFHSSDLKPFQKTLDGRLKELQSKQQPFQKQASAISANDEEEMWNKGVMGTHSPDAIINALMFLTGKLFVLRGGREQRDLQHDQFIFEGQSDGSMIVVFKEKVSKTNQGGLKRRKVVRKEVRHLEDPYNDRSFTFIYNFYVSKCPENIPVTAFYLRPKTKWSYSQEVWFDKSPMGHNTISKRFKKMCNDAGLEGNFSNHSGRATGITRMYQAGLSEKLIMQRSGHRSIEGVRTYQRQDPTDISKVSHSLTSPATMSTNESSSSQKIERSTNQDPTEDDMVLVKACEKIEESGATGISFGGINMKGANLTNVNINITFKK